MSLPRRSRTRFRRVASLGVLVASAMIALGNPGIDLLFVGGRFSAADGGPA